MAIRWNSLEWKLPLAIFSVLLVVLGTFVVIARLTVRRSALEAADERLRNLTTQLAELLQAEAPGAIGGLKAVAQRPEIAAYLAAPDSSRRASAIQGIQASSPQARVAAAELWDVDGHRILAIGDTSSLPGEGLLASVTGRDSGAVGPFLTAGDSLVLPTIVPVLAAGDRVGYLVEWRYISTSPQEREGMLQLIGQKSAFIMGSPSTGIWTDRASIVPPPPVDLEAMGTITSYERPGAGGRRAMAAPVAGTPWVVVIEFDEGSVLAPAKRFVTQTILMALGLLLAGLLGVWLIVHRMTRPLRQLTGAARGHQPGRLLRARPPAPY